MHNTFMVVIKDMAIYAPDKRWTDAFGTARESSAVAFLDSWTEISRSTIYVGMDQIYTKKLQWKSSHRLVDMICWRINDTEWLQTGKFYVMLIGMNTSCFHIHDLLSWKFSLVKKEKTSVYTLTTQATYVCNFSSDNNLMTFHYWNSWGISSY
jgi:hypothetical protein